MKFLADMPISPKTVTYLKSIGHDIYRISEKGLPKAKDREDESQEIINPLLGKILPEIENDILKGALVMVEDDRVRIRSLPIE